jgi:hypothetical protein
MANVAAPENLPTFDAFDDDFDDGDCGNCGGEGYVYDCIDGCCVNAEDGCSDCERRCDWCNRKPSPTSDALRQVLADALAKTNGEGE